MAAALAVLACFLVMVANCGNYACGCYRTDGGAEWRRASYAFDLIAYGALFAAFFAGRWS
jgi:hypothetical protein